MRNKRLNADINAFIRSGRPSFESMVRRHKTSYEYIYRQLEFEKTFNFIPKFRIHGKDECYYKTEDDIPYSKPISKGFYEYVERANKLLK